MAALLLKPEKMKKLRSEGLLTELFIVPAPLSKKWQIIARDEDNVYELREVREAKLREFKNAETALNQARNMGFNRCTVDFDGAALL